MTVGHKGKGRNMIEPLRIAFRSLIAHRRKYWANEESVALGVAALVLGAGD